MTCHTIYSACRWSPSVFPIIVALITEMRTTIATRVVRKGNMENNDQLDADRTQKRCMLSLPGIIFVCCLAAGCLHVRKPPEPEVVPPPPPPSDQNIAMQRENETLRRALTDSNQAVERLEQDIAGLKIQVLEYEAIVHNLRSRSDGQQKRLEAAIVDVVRSKAKLRSLESKAEAASTIAEAEIAVTALKSQVSSSDVVLQEEMATADQLLDMSAKEFKAQNFGGALYLANQTKGQVRALQMRLSSDEKRTTLEGETPFAQPLPLKVLKDKSNLREGPGLDKKISGRLNKGALLMGHSYKDRWIRVETPEGMTGWIFQSLVGAR